MASGIHRRLREIYAQARGDHLVVCGGCMEARRMAEKSGEAKEDDGEVRRCTGLTNEDIFE